MIKKVLVICLYLMIFQMNAMQRIADVMIDASTVHALETNSPDMLKKALDARMASIKLQFQAELNTEVWNHAEKKKALVQESNLVRATLIKGLLSSHNLRMRAITGSYFEAQEKFKNAEIPEYLRLALERRKTVRFTKSELLAQGGVVLAFSLMLAGFSLRQEASMLSTVILLPVGLAGCYIGAKELCDGIDYPSYLADQKRANDAVQQILKARQGNWFEQAFYQLKTNN